MANWVLSSNLSTGENKTLVENITHSLKTSRLILPKVLTKTGPYSTCWIEAKEPPNRPHLLQEQDHKMPGPANVPYDPLQDFGMLAGEIQKSKGTKQP